MMTQQRNITPESKYYQDHLRRMKVRYERNADSIKERRNERYFEEKIQRWLNDWGYTFERKAYSRKSK